MLFIINNKKMEDYLKKKRTRGNKNKKDSIEKLKKKLKY